MTGILLFGELLAHMDTCSIDCFSRLFGTHPEIRSLLDSDGADLQAVLVEYDPNEFFAYMARNSWLLNIISTNGNCRRHQWNGLVKLFPKDLVDFLNQPLSPAIIMHSAELFRWFYHAQLQGYIGIEFKIPSRQVVPKKKTLKKPRKTTVLPTREAFDDDQTPKRGGHTESLTVYLREIGGTPLIPQDEEIRLVKQYKGGDERALEKLIKANTRFVVSVAKGYQNRGLSLADLVQDGNMGLIKAAKRFDETRGFKFISYAVWWIKQAILQSLAEHGRIVRLPLNRVGVLYRVGKVSAKLEQELGREPNAEEISRELEVSADEVSSTLKISQPPLSLDAEFSKGETNTLMDVLEDENVLPPDQEVCDLSLRIAIEKALDSLRPREAEVIGLYFGLYHERALTLEEIGARFSLTRERVRQIKEKAISRLRYASRSSSLRVYYT